MRDKADPHWYRRGLMTMECSLLYVSRSTIELSRRDEEIAAIVSSAHIYNPKAGITGGLVRTQDWFAQLLEGSSKAVEALMQRIERDPRHTDVRVLRVAARQKRRLGQWSMAYAGEWHFIAQKIAPLLGPSLATDSGWIDRVEKLIVDFASA